MSILHLVRTSAYQKDDLTQCLQLYCTGDIIILMDEGCYNVTHPLLMSETHEIRVISEHCHARAITCAKHKQLTLAQLTPLFFSHNSVITWQ